MVKTRMSFTGRSLKIKTYLGFEVVQRRLRRPVWDVIQQIL